MARLSQHELEATAVNIPVAIIAHHAHLTAETIEILFCDHYQLHALGDLSKSEFSALESVTLVGPRGRVRNVPLVGPPRATNQIEITRSDADALGIAVPVRQPGDLIGSPGVTLEGPRAQIALGTGVICALRHIHMSEEDAARLDLKDLDRVAVTTHGHNRELQFRDVLVRVSPGYELELHLDTDEANAAGLRAGDYAMLERPIASR